tara:strand:- start:41 stop:727 length:687 start_codon:yes stop_codon:yes gene_type:complete
MTYSSSRSGSKKSYFRQLPNLDYPSLANDRTSAYDYIQVKNIFKRAVMREDVFDSYTQFEKYSVEGDDRPDNVASKVYGDPALDWVVLTTNNIIHIRDEWPMSQNDLNNYLTNKYTSQQLSYIHHYETLKILDSFGNLIQPEGIEVEEGHSITFVDRGVSKTISRLKSFTYLDHEIDLNDKKREIDILLPEYVEIFLRDIGNIMEYKPSDQFISENLKKTENPRIISP